MKTKDTTSYKVTSKDLVIKTKWAGVPATEDTKECYRCQLEMRGPSETQSTHCPRCAVSLSDEPIDVRLLTDEEKLARKRWTAASDLCLIYRNWANAYIRSVEEKGEADYSAVYDFALEVIEQSGLYVTRLRDEGLLDEMGNDMIRKCVGECVNDIWKTCDQYEDLMRLGGTWDDDEQDIKDHWCNRLQAVGRVITAPTTPRTQLMCSRENGEEG